MQILRANPADAEALTEIAFAAKRHWKYPEEWLAAWAAELRVTPELISEQRTFKACAGACILGFYSVHLSGHSAHLEHLWVVPKAMGQGIGRALFLHAVEQARAAGCGYLEIESDPHAAGFYSRLGAQWIGKRSGNVKGVKGVSRELPVYRFSLI